MSQRAWVEHLMGMPISIHVRCPDPSARDITRAVAAAYAELARMEDLFSIWMPSSQVSRLRRGEIVLSQCDPLITEAVRMGVKASALTAGSFTTKLPDATGELRFDPTGFVKGWAVDRAGTALTGLPGASWCINAGGDILAGRHRYVEPKGNDARPWRIGIEDPMDRSRITQVVPIVEGAMATSGTAARGAHLFDPIASEWSDRVASVTVLGTELVWADIWATALFVGGPTTQSAFTAFAADNPGYSWTTGPE